VEGGGEELAEGAEGEGCCRHGRERDVRRRREVGGGCRDEGDVVMSVAGSDVVELFVMPVTNCGVLGGEVHWRTQVHTACGREQSMF
jgi:hypothetical protein